ncbi:MAG TPA: hypothetical protein VIL30_17170 [Ramlibacter sp.]|jgi:hypothetical protein
MAALKNPLPSQPADLSIHPPEAAVEAVRQQLLALLDDCEGFDCERLRWRLHTAESAHDLWLLRGAVLETLTSQQCQAQAQDRIAALVPAFERARSALVLRR